RRGETGPAGWPQCRASGREGGAAGRFCAPLSAAPTFGRRARDDPTASASADGETRGRKTPYAQGVYPTASAHGRRGLRGPVRADGRTGRPRTGRLTSPAAEAKVELVSEGLVGHEEAVFDGLH